jgi:hypothetical protein
MRINLIIVGPQSDEKHMCALAVLHIPHSAHIILADLRRTLVVSDDLLAHELLNRLPPKLSDRGKGCQAFLNSVQDVWDETGHF